MLSNWLLLVSDWVHALSYHTPHLTTQHDVAPERSLSSSSATSRGRSLATTTISYMLSPHQIAHSRQAPRIPSSQLGQSSA